MASNCTTSTTLSVVASPLAGSVGARREANGSRMASAKASQGSSLVLASRRPASSMESRLANSSERCLGQLSLVTAVTKSRRSSSVRCSPAVVVASAVAPIRVIIAGAPASGKGTQCEDIVSKFGLVHISVGDLLRAAVAAQTPAGIRAKQFMDAGDLVPDDVVIDMVKDRLAQTDCLERGWLLDGYPRSESQGKALQDAGISPQLFLLLNVPDERILERVTGRRSDPVTGKIYHLKFSPPESEEIAARLTQRSDDTEEACSKRLVTYHKHLNAVLDLYRDDLIEVNGDRSKQDVFGDIDAALTELFGKVGKSSQRPSTYPAVEPPAPISVPQKMNNIPHSRTTQQLFYEDATKAILRALGGGETRVQAQCYIPEMNPEMDVYRVGTLLEMVRQMATTLAQDGKRVRICVQGSMGQGVFQGMPLALSGVRKIIDMMDWEEGLKGVFINFGSVGPDEVKEEDDVFIILAPQSIVGYSILPYLDGMCTAAGDKPIILINPKLGDIPSAGNVMQVRGRGERMAFAASFITAYHFRLLFISGTAFYPIMGAARFSYGGKWEIYRRENREGNQEEYVLIEEMEKEPTRQQITEVFRPKRLNIYSG